MTADQPSQPSQSRGDVTSLSLLARARSNDEEAWKRLVRLYGPLVYGWCRRAGLHDDDAADVFQDVFRTVSTGLGKYKRSDHRGAFRGWLRAITRTRVADHHRASVRQPVGFGGTDAQGRIASVPDPFDDQSEEEVAADETLVVQRAMELIQPEFTDRTWQAFQRIAIEGHTTDEVATALDMTDQAVRQANYRVRRRLRTELEDLFERLP